MTDLTLVDRLYKVCRKLAAAGWTVEPVDLHAPDSVTLDRLEEEERRLRVKKEAGQ